MPAGEGSFGDGELPDFPEGFDPFGTDSDSSERPDLPENFDPFGSDSDSSERPTPPDMSGDGTQMQDGFGGGEGGPGQMGGGMEGSFGDAADAADEEASVSTAISLSELSTTQWIWLGASLAVLILGLAIALLYKK